KDGGMRGVVIALTKLNKIQSKGNFIKADAGVLLKDVSDKAVENSLTGFEFACGIPGSVGGAVFMNAGAYGGEIKNVILEAEVMDNEGNIIVLSKDELELGYRTSKVMKENLIVISAIFQLELGEKEVIESRVEELTRKREEKQPLEYPSAGSTFKRPEGYFAGKLIQDAGLKGYSIGGAAVSEKHSGFVINKNGATAKDILDLIKYVQQEVYKQFGVELHTEVRILGED
ncbi:MAG: UDP-N-acetylmuramate dehydrogenase, partial [Clostridium sp.]|nr:UDP-N-acetylmuramate dehydrogenase [Clostridium sp.]